MTIWIYLITRLKQGDISENEFETKEGASLAAGDEDMNFGHAPVGTMRADHGGAPSQGSTRGPAPTVVDAGGAVKGASTIDSTGEQSIAFGMKKLGSVRNNLEHTSQTDAIPDRHQTSVFLLPALTQTQTRKWTLRQ